MDAPKLRITKNPIKYYKILDQDSRILECHPNLVQSCYKSCLSFDKSNRAIQRKYKWWAFLKISVENLVGHPIFSNSTIKGSSHSKSEEITSCWNCHPFWFVSPLCRFFSLSFGGFDVLCYTGTVRPQNWFDHFNVQKGHLHCLQKVFKYLLVLLL